MSLPAVVPTTFFRSMGVKLMVVCFLALLMTIPAVFVWGVISDRSERANQVVDEIGALAGGPQTFLGPVLAIPYTVPSVAPGGPGTDRGTYIVFPTDGKATVNTTTEVRHRSLFKVPVYRSDIAFDAIFDLTGVPEHAPEGAVLDWGRAEFLVGASDPRGAKDEIRLSFDGQTVPLAPATLLSTVTIRPPQASESQLTMFGAPAGDLAQTGTKFKVSANLRFSGAQRLAILAFGRTTNVSVKGDWRHPGFDGNVLPGSQDITDQGFVASWTVPYIARGVPAEGPADLIGRLGRTEIGVSFVEVADPYQSVTRALKYAVLFIGLVFLSYFLFEATSGKRLHPAQYILVGIAQMIFYLLLLSIAEHVGFDLSFLVAACATVGLISAYAGWTFGSRRFGMRALAAFSSLYALIYLLLRLEDQALLIGAVGSFAAISVVMYFTRHIDWYASPRILTAGREAVDA